MYNAFWRHALFVRGQSFSVKTFDSSRNSCQVIGKGAGNNFRGPSVQVLPLPLRVSFSGARFFLYSLLPSACYAGYILATFEHESPIIASCHTPWVTLALSYVGQLSPYHADLLFFLFLMCSIILTNKSENCCPYSADIVSIVGKFHCKSNERPIVYHHASEVLD